MLHKIGFIGAGNMANAIIGGLIKNLYRADLIHVSDPSTEKLHELAKQYGVHTYEDNIDVVKAADTVILAVKPQILPTMLSKLHNVVQQQKPLLISIAAGISVAKLAESVGDNVAMVRCMPNTPALVQQGITGLFANAHVSAEQRRQAEKILGAVGHTLWVSDEDDINKITALSGSGPAYFFYFMEALQAAGEKIGLDSDTARLLTLQTALGAAMLAKDSELPLAKLRENVTSPGGTTEKALAHMEQKELKGIIGQAVEAALTRARELSS